MESSRFVPVFSYKLQRKKARTIQGFRIITVWGVLVSKRCENIGRIMRKQLILWIIKGKSNILIRKSMRTVLQIRFLWISFIFCKLLCIFWKKIGDQMKTIGENVNKLKNSIKKSNEAAKSTVNNKCFYI